MADIVYGKATEQMASTKAKGIAEATRTARSVLVYRGYKTVGKPRVISAEEKMAGFWTVTVELKGVKD
jgi:hypothetical protein